MFFFTLTLEPYLNENGIFLWNVETLLSTLVVQIFI